MADFFFTLYPKLYSPHANLLSRVLMKCFSYNEL
jgi:hypothetical protein